MVRVDPMLTAISTHFLFTHAMTVQDGFKALCLSPILWAFFF